MLTARQQEIWNFLVEYVDRHGYPPTVREIGEQVGLASPSTVHAHLANLERAGLLAPRPDEAARARADRPRAARSRAGCRARRATCRACRSSVQIAAGGPMLAEQHIEEYVPMPATTKGDFLLRVKGESMIEAGILDGDLVIVQRAQDARNGEIVVALAGDDESADEATVKTFYREKGRVRLQPENSSLEPIYARHVADPRPRRGGLPGAVVGALTALHRSLDQELVALLRGASLECLACGEFVMHARGGSVFCPECGSQLADEDALEDGLPLTVQAG